MLHMVRLFHLAEIPPLTHTDYQSNNVLISSVCIISWTPAFCLVLFVCSSFLYSFYSYLYTMKSIDFLKLNLGGATQDVLLMSLGHGKRNEGKKRVS